MQPSQNTKGIVDLDGITDTLVRRIHEDLIHNQAHTEIGFLLYYQKLDKPEVAKASLTNIISNYFNWELRREYGNNDETLNQKFGLMKSKALGYVDDIVSAKIEQDKSISNPLHHIVGTAACASAIAGTTLLPFMLPAVESAYGASGAEDIVQFLGMIKGIDLGGLPFAYPPLFAVSVSIMSFFVSQTLVVIFSVGKLNRLYSRMKKDLKASYDSVNVPLKY